MSYQLITGDCLKVMADMPADSVDLCFFSPPYETQRTYSINFDLAGQQWVDWMVQVFGQCQRVCKGLVACVCQGRTRDYRWSAVPALLVADLHRAGFNLRNPPIFHRVGIPGSGGPDWLRGDYEWIVCTARPGKLPWSDNTAMGHPPKWAPGGEMSHRLADGARVNQWGKPVDANGVPTGSKNDMEPGLPAAVQKRPSHKLMSMSSRGKNSERKTAGGRRVFPAGKRPADKCRTDGTDEQFYDPPTVANPGNSIEDCLELPDLIAILSSYGNATKTDAGAMLRDLRHAIDSKKIPQWFRGVYTTLRGATILRSEMYGAGEEEFADIRHLPGVRKILQADLSWQSVLQQAMLLGIDAGNRKTQPQEGSESETQGGLRTVRVQQEVAHTPQGQESIQQPARQSGNPLQFMSQQGTQSKGNVFDLRQATDGARLLQEALLPIQEIWGPTLAEAFASLSASSCPGITDYRHHIVGGGVMGGDEFSSRNEAPFPEALAEFFVRSFAPEGGTVLDCFSGSGTTIAVAHRWKRHGIGIDVRQNQIELATKRCEAETPLMFA